MRYKWHIENIDKIISFLENKGGNYLDLNSEHELIRMEINGILFTLYKNKTLYMNETSDPNAKKLIKDINREFGEGFKNTYNNYEGGIDESGKGEVFGGISIAGIVINKEIREDMARLVMWYETKKKTDLKVLRQISRYIVKLKKEKKLSIFEKVIPPVLINKYNINKLLDIAYQNIINRIKKHYKNITIIIDDYGSNIKETDTIKEKNADNTYLTVRSASIIASYRFWQMISAIKNKYNITSSGNLSNTKTIKWINDYYEKNNSIPWFVKTYKPITKILKRKIKKEETNEAFPIITHNKSYIVCNKCGFANADLIYHNGKILCSKCNNTIKGAELSLWKNEICVKIENDIEAIKNSNISGFYINQKDNIWKNFLIEGRFFYTGKEQGINIRIKK